MQACHSAGGAIGDAVGVAAREVGDVQLALWIARLLQPDLQHSILQRALEGASAAAGPVFRPLCRPGFDLDSWCHF